MMKLNLERKKQLIVFCGFVSFARLWSASNDWKWLSSIVFAYNLL